MTSFRTTQLNTSYSNIAWFLLPVALLSGLLILLFDTSAIRTSQPQVLGRPAPGTELVSIRAPATTSAGDSVADYVPPDELIHRQVLEKLRLFRTEFRQMAPGVTVSAAPGSAGRNMVAKTLSKFLASAEFATGTGEPSTTALPEQAGADLLLYTREENREIVFQFLTALSPYLNGRVLLVFDHRATLGRLYLVVAGTPRFASNGRVVFPVEAAPAGAG